MHISNVIKVTGLDAKQEGAALLLMMIVLTLVISTVLITGIGKKSQNIKRDYVSSDVLAKAKKSLVGYAYVNKGALPCPDSVGNGLGDACSSVEGWLPWQTLGLKPLRDGAATCLRYAISSAYKGVAPVSLVDGDFEVQDESNSTRVSSAVAVIFAPLESLSGQFRGLGNGVNSVCGSTDSAADKNDRANYLDTISDVNNAEANPTVFIQGDKQTGFNDVSVWLSTLDITGSIPGVSCGVDEVFIGGECVAVQACDDGYSLSGDGECVDADGCLVTEAPNNGGQCKNIVCEEGYTANDGGQCIADNNGNGKGKGN